MRVQMEAVNDNKLRPNPIVMMQQGGDIRGSALCAQRSGGLLKDAPQHNPCRVI